MIKEIVIVSCLVGIILAFPNPKEQESLSKAAHNVEESVYLPAEIQTAGETLETAEQRWGGGGRGNWGRGGGGGWGHGGGGGWGRGGGGGWGRGGGGRWGKK